MPSPARHGVQHGRYDDGEGARQPDEEVNTLENKLGNPKKCPGKNNKKQKKCTKWTVEVDRLRTALDNRVGGPCEQSKSEKWCAKKK